MTKFIAKSYWEKTHRQYPGFKAVGYVDLGESFNWWMYRVREKVFLELIKKLPLNKDIKILDLGSGTGFYPKLFQKLGFKDITASDFSNLAILKLKKIPGIKVRKINLGSNRIPAQKYDLISCFDILFHLVDDRLYQRAFVNIGRLLKTKGYFIFSENLLPRGEFRGLHQVLRNQKFIFGHLKKNHFKIIARQPVFFLMNNPVSSDSFFLKSYWFWLLLILSRLPLMGKILGPLLYPLEIRLIKTLKTGPSTEIIITQNLSS